MSVRMGQLNGGGVQKLFRAKPWMGEAAEYAGYFLLGLGTGSGRLFQTCGPFGAAAVAAAGAELGGIFCLLGTALGYLIAGGLYPGIRYIATAFLVYTVGFITRGAKVRAGRWFMPLIAALSLGLTGTLFTEETLWGIPGLMRVFMEVVLGAGCAYFYDIVLRPEDINTESAELRRSISVAVLCACVLMGAGRLAIFKIISIGRLLAMLAVMAAGFCGGPFTGCAAGTAMGLGMDMAGGASLYYSAAYALAGLVSGALYRYGRLAFSLSFCAANAVAVLLSWSDGAHIPSLYECFIASVVFMVLPQAVLTPVGTLLRVGRGRGETAFRLYQARRLESLGEGFEKLYECAARALPEGAGQGEVTAVFDRAADLVCRACGGKERCWKEDGAATVSGLGNLGESMACRGTISVNDLPMAFRQKCVAPEAFVSAVNGELRGMMYRRQYNARLREGRCAAYGQFMDMAEVIRTAAREMSGTAGPDSAAERRLIRFLKSREVEAVCSVFRDGRGRLHAVVEGAELEKLLQEPDHLERLSEVMGVRLCRVKEGENASKGRLTLRQAEPLAVSVGIAALKKEGESVSGDRGTYFKTDGGLLCVILSDGMGTGARAAAESVSAVEILEQLLKAGVEPGVAMRLLNSAALLRNGEDWGYATVDLCCIDLFTGETCFYKYGAAPSYVKTGRSIRRVKCSSLAAGMLAGEGSQPDVMRMRLKPGSVALIASDGVLAERKDQWLRDILLASDGVETKTLAAAALKGAASRFGNADDMTALAIRVEERQ